jgi:hypothetical protein
VLVLYTQIDLEEISDTLLENLLHPQELQLFKESNALVFRLQFGANGTKVVALLITFDIFD